MATDWQSIAVGPLSGVLAPVSVGLVVVLLIGRPLGDLEEISWSNLVSPPASAP